MPVRVHPPRRLTTDGLYKKDVRWSPDGKRIAFARSHGGEFTIWTIAPDGTGLRQVTPSQSTKASQYEPDWSPDSARLVYVSYTFAGTDGFLHLHTISADGGDSRRIVTGPQFNMHPAWSPDGRTIAFCSNRHGNPEIYLCDADGGGVRRITSDPAMDQHPSWSPDGRQIAFDSNRDGDWEIYTMAADGSGVRRLTRHPSTDTHPRWSPDGRHIAFVTFRDGNDEVYVMDPDGGSPVNVSNHPAWDKFPAWRPDSRALAWVSYRGGVPDLYVAEIEW